jgi:hypothetical protein
MEMEMEMDMATNVTRLKEVDVSNHAGGMIPFCSGIKHDLEGNKLTGNLRQYLAAALLLLNTSCIPFF